MPPHSDAPSHEGFSINSFAHSHSAWHNDCEAAAGDSSLSIASSSPSSLGSSADGPIRTPEPGASRPLIPGIYVPTVCFFERESEDVDTATIAEHAVRLAHAGVTGLATQGSNGEAVHLTHAERRLVTATTRRALDGAGYADMPVIVGCGSQSTRETLQHCREAWEAGGDYALVLPPSYYATLFAPSCGTVLEYFTAVADKSPIPIIIYNFPGGAGGLDLSSDAIVTLAAHPNIAGVKLTCGNTGKLNRVVAATRKQAASAAAEVAVCDHENHPEFVVLAGSADFLIPALSGGGHGMLGGLANLAPKACIGTMQLYRRGQAAEAQRMQDVVARGDWTAIQAGVVGVKAGLEAWMGYGGVARSPLPRPTPEQAKRWKEGFRELMALEQVL